MDELMVFGNDEFGEVRTIDVNGETWFVASDVATALGYKNTRKALNDHVWPEDKNTVTIGYGITGNPNRVVINESGVYALIFRSKLSKAKDFCHWITKEVLPSIRKHGTYITPELLQDKEALLKQIEQLQQENKRLSENSDRLSYADVLKRRNWEACNTSTLAADFDLSARRLNEILEHKGIQYKDEYKKWHIADEYKDKGYVKLEKYDYGPGVCTTMKWTDEGCLFVASILEQMYIYPVIEKDISRWKDPERKKQYEEKLRQAYIEAGLALPE